jgi:hypothetical protein
MSSSLNPSVLRAGFRSSSPFVPETRQNQRDGMFDFLHRVDLLHLLVAMWPKTEELRLVGDKERRCRCTWHRHLDYRSFVMPRIRQLPALWTTAESVSHRRSPRVGERYLSSAVINMNFEETPDASPGSGRWAAGRVGQSRRPGKRIEMHGYRSSSFVLPMTYCRGSLSQCSLSIQAPDGPPYGPRYHQDG